MTDRVEKRIEVKAPVARVWRALTDYREFGEWFRVKIDGPFVAGEISRGHITHPGYEHLKWEAVVTATEPEAVYAGMGLKGPVYRYAFSAVSDEWLLDKQAVPLSGAGLAQSGGQLLKTLTNRVDAGLFTTAGVMNGLSVGVFEPTQTENWSANAGRR